MTKFTITDFKKNTFTSIAIVEGISKFTLHNKECLLKDISDANYDLDSLKEAILFKKEKLRGKLDHQEEKIFQELLTELKSSLKDVQIEEIPNTSQILHIQKHVSEFKRLERIFSIYLDSKKSVEAAMNSLLSSEDEEDWALLADLIYTQQNFRNDEQDVSQNYSKKLEEKISHVFQDACSKKDTSLCRKCFNILSMLSKQNVLIDLFLLSKGLLATEIHVHPPLITTIELDQPVIGDNSFDMFLKETLGILEECNSFVYLIFDMADDYMLSKIYQTRISINLGNFLNVGNPAIFLMCLESAHKSLQSFNTSVRELFPKSDMSHNLADLFSPFMYKAIVKETLLFDDVFDVLFNGTKSINTYILNGMKASKCSDYTKLYDNMLIVIDGFLNRREKLYPLENEIEILKLFSMKLCTIIDKIFEIANEDPFKAMDHLVHMYTLNKKVFGDKNTHLESLNSKLDETLRQTFDTLISECVSFVKSEISKITFKEDEPQDRLLMYLKTVLRRCRDLGDKNFKIVFYSLSKTTYDQLYLQIFKHDTSYGNVLKCIDEISGCFALHGISAVHVDFAHLKLIFKIAALEDDEFDKTISKSKASLTDQEYQNLLKTRTRRAQKKANRSTSPFS